MSGKIDCPACGTGYKSLGSHWRYSPDHRPAITSHQDNVVRGLLMGDAWLNRNHKNAILAISCTEKEYLEYLDRIFGVLGTNVYQIRSAEKSAKISRDSGLNENASVDNYETLYHWQTRSHPDLNEYRSWYSDQGKVWPDDIEITPTVLKHWYCGDGSLHPDGYISINVSNESGNESKLKGLFSNANLPTPTITEYQVRDNHRKCSIRWGVDDSEELFDYMGEPPQSYEYKWL